MKFLPKFSSKRPKPGSVDQIFIEFPTNTDPERQALAHALMANDAAKSTIVLENQSTLETLRAELKKLAAGFVKLPESELDAHAKPILLADHPTLFLEFTDLNLADETKLREFISKYGLIGGDELTESMTEEGVEYQVESISLWILLQLELRTIIRLWRSIRGADKTYSRSLLGASALTLGTDKNFEIEDAYNLIAYSDFPSVKLLIQPSVSHPEKTFENISDKEAIEFAARVFGVRLNKLLSLFEPKLELDPFNDSGVPRVMQLGIMSLLRPKDESQAVMNHSSLFGAIVFQLLDAINQDKEFRLCLECFSWMPSSQKGKSGNRYCCSNCRNKASRRRRDINLIGAANPEWISELKTLIQEFADAVTAGDAEKFSGFREQFKRASSNVKGEQNSLIRGLAADIIKDYSLHLSHFVNPRLVMTHFGFSDDAFNGFYPLLVEGNYKSISNLKGELRPSFFDWSWLPDEELNKPEPETT